MERQLTFDACGHTLYHSGCFSKDDLWLVFDSRNDETKIGSTATIKIVNTKSGEIRTVYQTHGQTEFGPGVGAASFSPAEDKVVFIHGLFSANVDQPYGFTRRTAVAVDLHNPMQPIMMDARQVTEPFVPGALRGGTHAHSFSPDGQWLSFTYNDAVMEQLAMTNSKVKDLRTVAVMAPYGPVIVDKAADRSNQDGKMFSAVVVSVTETPMPGSDEIIKACEECWIGQNGYHKANGDWQKRALAFQGDVIDGHGVLKTEIFVVDLPDDITRAQPGQPLAGTADTRPGIPAGVSQRRVTNLPKGVKGPRHWLRSTTDGELIAFLAEDDAGCIQVFGVSPNGGTIKQLTFNPFSVQSGFSFDPGDSRIAYIADGCIYITDLKTGITQVLVNKREDVGPPTGNVNWSHDGQSLAYNRFVQADDGHQYLQIFILTLDDKHEG